MENPYPLRQKLGILGGGQLGLMILPEALKLGLNVHFLDPDPNASCAPWSSNFVTGDFRDEQTVLEFGKDMDVLTVEIEQVNVNALEQLERMGKQVFPSPAALRIIQDKGLQKQAYAKANIPTAPFEFWDGAAAIKSAIEQGLLSYPFVQKTREMGYDGKGVSIIRDENDLPKLLDGPSITETLAPIEKELAIIVSLDAQGNFSSLPVAEMIFHPTANLVEYLQSPANVSPAVEAQMLQMATDAYNALGMTRGVLAVEFFLLHDGTLWVNESAPRVHNSGHHTIQCCDISQFEMHLRSVIGLPVPQPTLVRPGLMLNLLGEPGHSGPAYYEGLSEVLALPGVSVHLYGKKETRPFRKMGHVTIAAPTIEAAKKLEGVVKTTLKCVSK